MAEEAAQEKEGDAAEGGKKKIPMWLIILIGSQVVLIGVAVVVLKMLSGSKKAAEVPAEPTAAEQKIDPEKIKDPSQLVGPIHELAPFIVNLIDDGRGPRFLKLQMHFELEVPPNLKPAELPPVKVELEKREKQIRDELLMLLTSKRQTDIETSDGKRILRDEIFTRINKLLVTGSVKRVFFTDFVIQ